MVIMLPLEKKRKKERKKWKLKKNHNSLMCEFLCFYNLWIEMHFLAHGGILEIQQKH